MTEPITSSSNPRIKELRKLHERKHRERTGLFLAEGEDMLVAALNHGHVPETVYFDPESRRAATAPGWSGAGPGRPREPSRARAASAAGRGWSASGGSSGRRRSALRRGPFYLHDVADPGNVGTILRAAQAFGAGAVVLARRRPIRSARRPYAPAWARSSASPWPARPGRRRAARAGNRRGARARRGHARCGSSTGRRPPLFVLGAERAGLPREIVGRLRPGRPRARPWGPTPSTSR